ncbi:PEGA domain-containing protein [Sorangium sp. So ce119]|uniref:PEGA domain-containing protein n=1 Tax=Sorangium sp. So ce119 TaxID=3133279 RepID=UPI003F6297CC
MRVSIPPWPRSGPQLSLVKVSIGLSLSLCVARADAQDPPTDPPKESLPAPSTTVTPPAPNAADSTAAAPSPAVTPPALETRLNGLARIDFDAGRALLKSKDYANALIKFRGSYERSKDPGVLWFIARCEQLLGHYTRVADLASQIEKDPSPLLSAADRQDAAELVRAVTPYISFMSIDVSEAGAEVFVDDESRGKTPLKARLRVDVGRRRIRIVKPGFTKYERVVEVSGQESLDLHARLTREVQRARLLITAGRNDQIALDGKVVARERWEGTVPIGGHSLLVTAPGMFPKEREVSLLNGETRRIEMPLDTTRPPRGGPVWVWVTTAAVLTAVAAGGIASMFEMRTDPSRSSPEVNVVYPLR